jgi:hypothetical protein
MHTTKHKSTTGIAGKGTLSRCRATQDRHSTHAKHQQDPHEKWEAAHPQNHSPTRVYLQAYVHCKAKQ